ncbi:hypothetical protein ACFQWB_15285 [Paenibacillus thermoaerophilus]|uniref:DUF5348 domain-containing protein n=1 Tax=Paenibacillus thermoaerophilus TaxID=1215385 RepID=A0ABW2V6U3_9BACL|nr:hypothetical protein [Paenibacillus thermoaerophilus]TMV17904.1 hypothetical protein FE781_05500 [Paenibacillus thermoaerophilus]
MKTGMEHGVLLGKLLAWDGRVLGLVREGEQWSFLLDGERYPLNNRRWDFELLLARDGGLFTFYWDGETKCSLRLLSDRQGVLDLYEHLRKI